MNEENERLLREHINDIVFILMDIEGVPAAVKSEGTDVATTIFGEVLDDVINYYE